MSKYKYVVYVEDVDDPGDHDARGLMFLAGINAACNKGSRPRVVLDLLDPRNIPLARSISADDVIIGSELVSKYMVQIALAPSRYQVLDELLNYGGSEIYIKPLHFYGKHESPFNEIMEAARLRDEIAIGYTWKDSNGHQCVINPCTAARTINASKMDKVVVLARNK